VIRRAFARLAEQHRWTSFALAWRRSWGKIGLANLPGALA
jgi:hypothetical protein